MRCVRIGTLSGEKRDFMQVAREVVERAIGEQMDGSPLEPHIDIRNPHAVALGKIGGKKGGEARAKALSPSRRRAIAKKAANLAGKQTLRVTPAMESGLSNHVWSIEELCALLPGTASATKRIDKGLILKALGERAS